MTDVVIQQLSTEVVVQQGGQEVVLVSGGAPGLSAFQIAQVYDGFEGTQSEWLASLVGADGASAYQIALANGFVGDASAWLASLIGGSGPSAYDVAVAEGFVGTQAQWLKTLRGVAGLTAYEIAVADGYQGTQVQWLLSLVGAPGADAYAIAVAQGFPGTPDQWLQSLIGAQGLSAYQVALNEGFSGTAGEWLDSLKGDPGDPGGIVSLGDAPYVPQFFADITAGGFPDDAQSIGKVLYDNRIAVADVFYSLNGRLPDHGDNIGPAINIVFDTVRQMIAASPRSIGSRGGYATFTAYVCMGVNGKLLYTDVTLNLTQLRLYGGVLVDFENCPIELRTPGVEGVNTLGTWFTKFRDMVFFGPSEPNTPNIGWLDGRTNVPAGDGHVQVAANKSYHDIRMFGDYRSHTYYCIASEEANYWKPIWGSDNSNPDKVPVVLTATNRFDVVSTVPGVVAYNGKTEAFNSLVVQGYTGTQAEHQFNRYADAQARGYTGTSAQLNSETYAQAQGRGYTGTLAQWTYGSFASAQAQGFTGTQANWNGKTLAESYIAARLFGMEIRQRALKGANSYAARAGLWIDGVKSVQIHGGFINAADCRQAIVIETNYNAAIYHFYAKGCHIEPTSCEYAFQFVNTENLGIRGFYFEDHEPLVNTAIFDLNGFGNTILDFTYVGPCSLPLFANGGSSNIIGRIHDTEPGAHGSVINVGTLRRWRGPLLSQNIANIPSAAGNVDFTAITATYSGPIRGQQSVTVSGDTVNISALDAGQVRLTSTVDRVINNIIRNADWPLGMIIYIHIGGIGGRFTFNHLGNLNNGAIITRDGLPQNAGTHGTIALELISGAIVPGGPTYLYRQV